MVSGRLKTPFCPLAFSVQLVVSLNIKRRFPRANNACHPNSTSNANRIALLENRPATATHVEKFLQSRSLSTAAPRNAEARSAEEKKREDIPCPSPQTAVATERRPLPARGSWGTPCWIEVARWEESNVSQECQEVLRSEIEGRDEKSRSPHRSLASPFSPG